MRAIDRLCLGWQTELIFPRFDGEVVESDEFLVVRTPHNPTFHWGNFLLFDGAPQAGGAAHWLAAFDAEIAACEPRSKHIAIGVDTPHRFELPEDFGAAGLALDQATTLTLTRERLRTPRRSLGEGFALRPLDFPAEARAAVDLQVAADADGYEPVGYRIFRAAQMARYAVMQETGLGHWFGIWARTTDGETLVADCGLFRDRDRERGLALGRFQHVCTHPAWRRQGLCTALIHAVCRHGFEAMALDTLVIVADPEDVAIGLYESLGFARHDTMWRLYRRGA